MKDPNIYSRDRRQRKREEYAKYPIKTRARMYLSSVYKHEIINDGLDLNDKQLIDKLYAYLPEALGAIKYIELKEHLQKVRKTHEDKKKRDNEQNKLFE